MMEKTKEELQVIQDLKINFNRLHASGQLLVEIVKENMPDESLHMDVGYMLQRINELTTCIPRMYLQLLFLESEECTDYPKYFLQDTASPNTMWAAFRDIKKDTKLFAKKGRTAVTNQLGAIETHILNCIDGIQKLIYFQHEVGLVHKKTGVVCFDFLPELEKNDELNDYIPIHPELVQYGRKYNDGILKVCSFSKSKRRKDTEICTVPEKYWAKKGKHNSEEFRKWLVKAYISITTQYDLSYAENL